jgi:hypothetical protein
MGKTKIAIPILMMAVITLSGCGTAVPNIQEIGDDTQGEYLVKAIVGSIRCSLRNAIYTVMTNDYNDALKYNNGHRYAAFLDNWGVLVAVTLQVEEKTTVNPTAVWTPPGMPVFTLGGSLTGSSDATRKDVLNYYYTVAELKDLGPCRTNYVQEHPPGSLLIDNDLKIDQWLSSQINLSALNEISFPNGSSTIVKQNAISHEVKFEIISTGSINPAWKLTRFTVNQSGSLFAATRDRVHDLQITLGPKDPTQKDTLAPTAQGQFFTNQLGFTISTITGGVLTP